MIERIHGAHLKIYRSPLCTPKKVCHTSLGIRLRLLCLNRTEPILSEEVFNKES